VRERRRRLTLLAVALQLSLLAAACRQPTSFGTTAPTAVPTPVLTSVPAATATPDTAPRDIVIIHTSDEHGYLEPIESGSVAKGGATLVSALWASRGYDPLAPDSNVLLLSSGDNWTGPAISTWFKGESAVEAMTAMGYRASVPGNHEFDFGLDVLDARLRQAKFPYLAANVLDTNTGQQSGRFEPYTIVEVNGIRVGVIGLALRSTANSTAAKNVEGLRFGDYEPALREWVPQARQAGAQVLVVQAHACAEELLPLAAAVQDLDIALIEGGHCHVAMADRAGKTLVAAASSAWQDYVLTRLVIDPQSGTVLDADQKLVDVNAPTSKSLPTAPLAVQKVVTRWHERAQTALGEVIGYTKTGVGQHSPEMHNLLVDSWLWAYPNAQIAISNTGGFRASLNSGEITLGEMVGVLPFDNELLEIEATGSQIVQALASAPDALVIGGAMMRGNRLIMADGREAEANATYRLLITDYLYDNVKYPFARFDQQPYETSINWRQPVIDWIQAQRSSREQPLEQLLDPMERIR